MCFRNISASDTQLSTILSPVVNVLWVLVVQVKGIMRRIRRLLLVNATLTLAPPPRLKAHMPLVVAHAYNLVTGRYVFIESPTLHPARCYWLGATHHCPEVDLQKRELNGKTKCFIV